jgi:hypothetical protein
VSYFDEVPEAKAFAEEVMENSEKYVFFEKEKYLHLVAGVLGATNYDSKGESIPVESLQYTEEKIKHGPFWVNDNHDPRKPPVGRILAAKVFYAPSSKVHFLAGVMGLYDTEAFPTFTDLEIDLSERLPVDELLAETEDEPFCHLLYDPHDIPPDLIAELFSDAPPFVTPIDETLVHKGTGDDQIAQIIILASKFLIAYNPLTKEFFGRVGSAAGDAFVKWTKHSASKIYSRLKRRALFKWETEYQGCTADFMVDTENPEEIAAAVQQIADASSAAGALVRSLQQYGPERVAYLFDTPTEKWLPLYAVTKGIGIISDRPYLISLEKYKGFSLGGVGVRGAVE